MIPRRRYRGLTVLEAIISLAAGLALVAALTSMAERVSRRTLLQAEARVVSTGADGALLLAEADIRGAAQAATAAGGALVLTRGGLLADGALPTGYPPLSPSGRNISFAHYAASADTVWAAAWLDGGPIAGGAALPAIGIEQTGRLGRGATIDACPTTHLCGPGLRRDISSMLTALGGDAPPAGSMMAIRSASLLRINENLLLAQPLAARPELSRMDADLEVTGTIVNVTGVTATPVELQIPAGGSMEVTGLYTSGAGFTGDRVEMRGEATIGGNLTVTAVADGLGFLRGGGGRVTTINAGEAQLDVLGDAAFGTTIAVGLNAARSAGAVADESGLLEAGSMAVPVVRAPWLDTGNVEITGEASASLAEMGELRIHAAAGRATVAGPFRSEGTLFVDDCPNCGTVPP